MAHFFRGEGGGQYCCPFLRAGSHGVCIAGQAQAGKGLCGEARGSEEGGGGVGFKFGGEGGDAGGEFPCPGRVACIDTLVCMQKRGDGAGGEGGGVDGAVDGVGLVGGSKFCNTACCAGCISECCGGVELCDEGSGEEEKSGEEEVVEECSDLWNADLGAGGEGDVWEWDSDCDGWSLW